MQHEVELAYIGIEVPDPQRSTPFFGEIIGLVSGEATDDGALTWRNDDKAHRVIVRPGPANDAVFLGFEAVDDDAFDADRQHGSRAPGTMSLKDPTTTCGLGA